MGSDSFPYRVLSYPMDTAVTDLEVRTRGAALYASTDGVLSGVSVRLDSKTNDAVDMDKFNPVGLKWRERFYLTFTAQSGKTLTLLVVLDEGFVGREPSLISPVSVTTPISVTAALSGKTDTSYFTVASWTVTTGKTGVLEEVSLASDTPSKTKWRLTIAGTEVWADRSFQSESYTASFPDNQLLSGQTVLLEAASTDGTTIAVDGAVTGAEK